MKGGVIKRNPEANDFETLFKFIENSECEILTDASLACITYKFTRRDKDTDSPYISCRSTNLKQNVNSILLKIFLSGIAKDIYKIRSRGGSRVPVTNSGELKNEVDIQEFVYKKSYVSQISTCEPICPSIIMYSNTLDKDTENKLYEYIIENISAHHRTNSKGVKIDDTQITFDWFNKDDKNKNDNQKGIKIIAMELMDGYITLHKYLYDNKEKPDNQIKALHKCMWQFINLSKIVGISHHDCNFGNIMINEDNQYFDEVDKGQPIIIDFGRAANFNQDLIIKEDNTSIETMTSITTIEQYISELNKHKYYDYAGWVKALNFEHKYPAITLLDYWNYEINRIYKLNILDILNIGYLNNLTQMRIKMTQNFNDALTAQYKTDFTKIIKEFITNLEKARSKRKRGNELYNKNNKRILINVGKEMTFENIFTMPNGGGNNTFSSKNIYKDVFTKISLEEFKKFILKEIMTRPIEILFPEDKQIQVPSLQVPSLQVPSLQLQTLTTPLAVHGGTRKYKQKHKYKSKKTKKHKKQ